MKGNENWLKHLRDKKGFTQESFSSHLSDIGCINSKKAPITLETYRRWERGEPKESSIPFEWIAKGLLTEADINAKENSKNLDPLEVTKLENELRNTYSKINLKKSIATDYLITALNKNNNHQILKKLATSFGTEKEQDQIEAIAIKTAEIYLKDKVAMSSLQRHYNEPLTSSIKQVSNEDDITYLEELLASLAFMSVNPCSDLINMESGQVINIAINTKAKVLDHDKYAWIVRLSIDSQINTSALSSVFKQGKKSISVSRYSVLDTKTVDETDKGHWKAKHQLISHIFEKLELDIDESNDDLKCPDLNEENDHSEFIQFCEKLADHISLTNSEPTHFFVFIHKEENQYLLNQLNELLEELRVVCLENASSQGAHVPLYLPHGQLEQWLAGHLYALVKQRENLERKLKEQQKLEQDLSEKVSDFLKNKDSMNSEEKTAKLSIIKSTLEYMEKAFGLTKRGIKIAEKINELSLLF